jgi:hypothetical protein
MIERAVRNEPQPDVYNQPAPFADGERYVLLTGDANFSHIPSTAAQRPPVAVAVLAMHHGSNMSDGEFLDSSRIPLAPGSDAEQVANRTNGGDMVAYAISAAGAAGQPQDVRDAAIAAAAALRETFRLRRRGRERARWALTVAAATAAAAWNAGQPNFALIALAAIIAYEMTPDTLATSRVVLVAQQLLARPNPPNPRQYLRGACHVRVEQNVLTAANALSGAPNANNLRAAFAATTYAHAALLDLADHALTAVTAALAQALPYVANAAQQDATQMPLFAAPRSNAAAAQMAATHAAIAIAFARAAAVRPGREPEVIENAVRAAIGGRVIPANPGAGPQNATMVCFPYGVQNRPNGAVVHPYPSAVLGGFGHPHPLAIAKYQSKGWTTRWNACAKVQRAGANWSGHVALGWNAANDAALQNQQIAFNCLRCARGLNFNC